MVIICDWIFALKYTVSTNQLEWQYTTMNWCMNTCDTQWANWSPNWLHLLIYREYSRVHFTMLPSPWVTKCNLRGRFDYKHSAYDGAAHCLCIMRCRHSECPSRPQNPTPTDCPTGYIKVSVRSPCGHCSQVVVIEGACGVDEIVNKWVNPCGQEPVSRSHAPEMGQRLLTTFSLVHIQAYDVCIRKGQQL